jgi:hypothetical protein
MKKQKLKIEIEVWGIEVEETAHYENGHGSGWWKFEYSVRKNGGKKKLGQEDGSWSGQTKANFLRVLRNGHAAYTVLEGLS